SYQSECYISYHMLTSSYHYSSYINHLNNHLMNVMLNESYNQSLFDSKFAHWLNQVEYGNSPLELRTNYKHLPIEKLESFQHIEPIGNSFDSRYMRYHPSSRLEYLPRNKFALSQAY